jgi:NAD-dependent deacetylase
MTGRLLQDAAQAWLKSFAHVAFLDRPTHGLLVFVAIAAIAPWSAAAAAFGAALAILLGKPFFSQSEWEWKEGLGAYDCALLGIAWGGAFSRGPQMMFLLGLAVLACLAMRGPLVSRLNGLGMPVLALPGLISIWLSLGVFSALGADFWLASPNNTPGSNSFGSAGPAVAIFFVTLGLFLKCRRAAAASVLVATATAILYSVAGGDPLSIQGAGLWAFTAAPAIFASSAVFLNGFRQGWKVGATAALLSAAIWLLWNHMPLLENVPPLMGPLFIGIWSALILVLGKERQFCLDLGVQHAAHVLDRARPAGATLVLTGAGVSTASGIPDYTAGHWLAPGVPASRYSYGAFLADAESRSLYWDACARFREVAARAKPNNGHLALAGLEASGYILATITQNVDGLHQAAGSRQVGELHGTIFSVRCLACDHEAEWPAADLWRHASPCCEMCGGLLKPAVIAFGESIRLATWHDATEKAAQCGAILVVGSQLAVSSASALLASARARGVPCVFLTLGSLAVPLFPGDTVIDGPAELVLPALARLLEASPPKATFS